MTKTYTAFSGVKNVASGPLDRVVSTITDQLDSNDWPQVLIFDDATGRQIDVDYHGPIHSKADTGEQAEAAQPRRVGRPKLGVVSGEVTLLPRHWEWLKNQPGGASVTLRKLVEDARRGGAQQAKASQEATYHFMTSMAGNFPHYEEALRELYAGNQATFHQHIEDWAVDVKKYMKELSSTAFTEE
ncbi:DUF2239 family protein [Rossellomorea marisflavi]|uniref:DUF2239 family protein n=1 Tax=Rossellomorea marisflavi TaxID=189381 RepID=UPI003458C383